jgi:Dolichyl-phosphate-mannose-protein mannosyltransferase
VERGAAPLGDGHRESLAEFVARVHSEWGCEISTRPGNDGLAALPPSQPVARELRSIDSRACWLAILIHVAVRVLGVLVLSIVGFLKEESAYRSLLRWDANWYRGIALHGYGSSHSVPDGRTLADYAFFPLYPALERLVAEVTGLRIMDAGLVISAVSSVVAAGGIFAVGARIFDARAGIVLVMLWSTLPISIVQSMAYAESLFTALVAWSLYAIVSQSYIVAGLLAALAGLCRPMGGALVVAVVVAVVLHVRSARLPSTDEDGASRHMAGPMVGALIAPLGAMVYPAYVGFREDSIFGYVNVATRWGNGIDGGVSFYLWIARMLLGPDFLAGVLVSGALVLLACVLARMIRDRYPVPILVYTVLSVLVALSTSGYFGSRPRYLLPVFPLLMPLAVSFARMQVTRIVTISIGLAMVASIYGSIWLFGPGPP